VPQKKEKKRFQIPDMSTGGGRSRSRSRSRSRKAPSSTHATPGVAASLKKDVSSTGSDSPLFTLRVAHVLVVYVVLSTGLGWYWHHRVHGVWSPVQILLCFFLGLNFLISLWEVALWRYIEDIEKHYRELQEQYGERRLEACLDFFTAPVTLWEVFSLRYWARVWSTYSLYDPAYSSKKSYGFWIDVGNGHSMLIPSILLCINMTLHWPMSPKVMGVVGIICYYQMFYGCVLYFLQFFANGRHRGKSSFEVALFVGVSNGIWISFPLLGLWACIMLIATNTWQVFM
jgi:hypothetical protein